jgi:hypothetical protein
MSGTSLKTRGNGHTGASLSESAFYETGGLSPGSRAPTARASSTSDLTPVADVSKFMDITLASPDLQAMVRVVHDAITTLDEGVTALEEDMPIAAADGLHQVVEQCRELMCLRLGDGFTAIASGILAALENLIEVPTTRQLYAIRARLDRLQKEPFIGLSASDEELEKLEKAGLNVNPPGLSALLDAVVALETPDE